MDRMFGLLSASKEVADAPDARPLVVDGGQVRFEHVSFAYEPSRPILHDVTFTIDAVDDERPRIRRIGNFLRGRQQAEHAVHVGQALLQLATTISQYDTGADSSS